ncbi:MAG TPA: phytanoyl-CoA dioxygenase [Alphaproteobacteria bacterium]|nr:phytanoyl-CoA dioxygenase [Alphaproteobacteria bacterium]HCM07891.1 phytanoyl-CoA dioxygenase [Alphaproteobacteria bacterium]
MPEPLTLASGRLTTALANQYWQDGFLFPIDVMPGDEAAGLRAELESLEARWQDNSLPHPLNTYKRVNSHCVMPLSCRIASDPRILDVVEGVLGPDIMIYGVEYFIKEANSTQIVSMHQDLTYWGLGATSGMVTVWLALSASTPASGCMDFVRASHKNPILPHNDTFDDENLLSRGQEVTAKVDAADKTPIEIHPGQISMHHGLTIHGSGPNTTGDRRIACVIRYINPDVVQQVGQRDYAMMARGVDRNGHFIHFAPPRSEFQPESLALYDEIRDMQATVTMQGTRNDKGMYA